MQIIYLLPGIMGSRLALNGEEIWPPTLSELTVSHYSRMSKLSDPSAISTDVIRRVTDCYVVYDSLIDELRSWGYAEAQAGGARGKLVAWHYDWRTDNRDTAARLSKELTAVVDDGTAEVIIIAHSMGGLIARYALETDDPKLGNVAWRKRCKLLVTMGTPHRGAPLALVRALGLESAMGLRASDIRSFTADSRFPAGYQLLPPTDAFAFWNSSSVDVPLSGIDLTDPKYLALLKLSPQNMRACSEQFEALRRGQRPPTCRYFNFVGRKLDTVVRGNLDSEGSLDAPKVQDGGDGTVPIWSGTLPATQFQLDGDEHGRTFRDPALLATLGLLLGVPRAAVRAATAPIPVTLKIPKPVFTAGEPAKFRVDFTLAQAIDANVFLQRIDEQGTPQGPPAILASVSSATLSESVTVAVRLPSQAGLYNAFAAIAATRAVSEPQALAVQIN